VGDHRHAQLSGGRQQLLLEAAFPQGPLLLQGSDGVHGHGATKILRRHVRQAQPQHEALGHQTGHGLDGVLNRDVVAAVVEVVEVDDVHAQATQAAFARLPDVTRIRSDLEVPRHAR
jgi:hypothetical protein